MKKYIIDTNCLISYVTDRNIKQQSAIAKYFELAFHYDIELIVISNVITEFAHVLTNIYSLTPDNVNTIIVDLLETPGIEFEPGYIPKKLFQLWPSKIKNYGDAVLGAFGEYSKIEILTFDLSFSKELKKLDLEVNIPR